MNWSKVQEALRGACSALESTGSQSDLVTPGAVLLVGQQGEIVFHEAFGCRSLKPAASPMESDTVFDIASLTKALITTTLAMRAVDAGLLTLDRKVSSLLPGFGVLGKERISVQHLLQHSSGYPAWAPLYKSIERAERSGRTGIMMSRGAWHMMLQELYEMKLENLPGKVATYSDLGFLLLGAVIESVFGGIPLDRLAIKHIVAPLSLRSLGYIDISKLKARGLEADSDRIAPTAECPWRRKILCGVVHDDNAYVLGGVAPHAGIFSDAVDVHRIAAELIACYHGHGSLVRQETVQAFWTRDETILDSTWAVGWDTPSVKDSSAGKYFSEESVGHLGFTGCSVWIDPTREIDVVLLTNRVHPSVENTRIRQFRPLIHDLVMETLGAIA